MKLASGMREVFECGSVGESDMEGALLCTVAPGTVTKGIVIDKQNKKITH